MLQWKSWKFQQLFIRTKLSSINQVPCFARRGILTDIRPTALNTFMSAVGTLLKTKRDRQAVLVFLL